MQLANNSGDFTFLYDLYGAIIHQIIYQSCESPIMLVFKKHLFNRFYSFK